MGNFAVIILAAGQSSRLGHPKQLVEIDGESLLVRQCTMALSITKHVYCVLGFQSALFQQKLSSLPVNIVINSSWRQGMSSSIASAVRVLPQSIASIMVLLVDQWQLRESLLTPIINTFCENTLKIVTSSNSNLSCYNLSKTSSKSELLNTSKIKIGPPTIFPKRYFSALSELTGKDGAKTLIFKEKKSVIQLKLLEAFIDLDNADDLSKLRAIYPN